MKFFCVSAKNGAVLYGCILQAQLPTFTSHTLHGWPTLQYIKMIQLKTAEK